MIRIIFYFIGFNTMVFIVFGVDKFFAMKNMYRISEKNLLALAIFGGGLGALLGQRIFRHKTKKFGNILLILSIVQIIGSMVYVIR